MDADKAYWEKASWKMRKDATSSIKQILEATSNKIAAVRPPTSKDLIHNANSRETERHG